MKGFRTAIGYAWIVLKNEWKNTGIYFFLLFIFLAVQFICPGIAEYLNETNSDINVWELYIWFMSARQSQLIYLAGMIGLGCNVTKMHQGVAYYLMRMDRRTWILSQTCLLLFHILIINLFLIFSFAVACGGRITLQSEWSRAAVTAAQFRVKAIGVRGIMSVPFGLLQHNPNSIGFLSFLLAVLLGMAMGQFMMLCSLKANIPWGMMAVFGMWFLDILAVYVPMFEKMLYFLPFGLSRVSYTTLNYGMIPPEHSVIFLLLCTLLLMQTNLYISKSADFTKMD